VTTVQHRLAVVAVAAALLPASACAGGSPPRPTVTATGPSTFPFPSTAATTAPTTAQGVDPNAPEPVDAGDIPDNQVFVPYEPASKLFEVKVPEGWSQVADGGAVMFDGKLNSIRIEVRPAAAAPDVAAVRAEVAAIGASANGFQAGSVQQVARHAGTGILARYRADAAPDPVTGKVVNDDVERYEFWHGGQLVTLILSGPHGADNVDPWRTVTDSLRWR
jgi:hypothetical protein